MEYLRGVFRRTLQVIISLALTIDILAQVIIKAPFWIFFKRARPSSRETISATLGWGQAHGYKWCSYLADLVDVVFGKDHCKHAYQNELWDEFPL